jgi:hypothetical protein
MFKVTLQKSIYFTHADDYDNRAVLHVNLELPFAPYPGLKITFGTGLFGDAIIDSVSWLKNESYFYCETLPVVDPEPDLSFWLESGWELRGTFVHGKRQSA